MRALSILAGQIAICLLAGCSFGGQVQSMGPDTYTVSNQVAPVSGGSVAAREMALQEANAFCEKQGKSVLVTNTSESYGTDYSVTFRCLLSDDPDLKRPTYQAAPDLVVRVQ